MQTSLDMYFRKRKNPYASRGGPPRKKYGYRRRRNVPLKRYGRYRNKRRYRTRKGLGTVSYGNRVVTTLMRCRETELTSEQVGTEKVIRGLVGPSIEAVRTGCGFGNQLYGYANMYDQWRIKSMTQTFWLKHADQLTNPAKDEIVTLHTTYDPDANGRLFADKDSFIITPHTKIRFMKPLESYSVKVYPRFSMNTYSSTTTDGPPLEMSKKVDAWLDTSYFNSTAKGTAWANGIQYYIDGLTEAGVITNETKVMSRVSFVLQWRGIRRGNGYA